MKGKIRITDLGQRETMQIKKVVSVVVVLQNRLAATKVLYNVFIQQFLDKMPN